MALLTAEHPDPLIPSLCAAADHGDCSVSDVIARYVREGLVRDGFYRPPVETTPDTVDEEELKKEFLEEAMGRARKLSAGTLFSLNADHPSSERLFTRDEWRQLIASGWFKPTAMGRSFKHAVVSAGLAKTEEKTAENKQIYARR